MNEPEKNQDNIASIIFKDKNGINDCVKIELSGMTFYQDGKIKMRIPSDPNEPLLPGERIWLAFGEFDIRTYD